MLPQLIKMDAFIKLIRSDKTFSLLKRDNDFRLLCFIAMRVSRNGNEIEGLEPGEAKMGDYQNYGMSRQQYRTALKNLKKFNFLTTKATNNGTIVKLVNTEVLDVNVNDTNQQVNHPIQPTANQQATNSQPASNQQPTTNKKEKIKEDKELKNVESENAFKLEIWKFKNDYDHELLKKFYLHFSEWNRSKTKMKFESEKTWELNKRLAKWKSNNYGNKSKKNEQDPNKVGKQDFSIGVLNSSGEGNKGDR